MGSNKGPIAASGRLTFSRDLRGHRCDRRRFRTVLWIGIGGNSADQNLAADPLVETSVSDNESIDLPTTTTNEIAVQTSTTKPTPSSTVTTTTAPTTTTVPTTTPSAVTNTVGGIEPACTGPGPSRDGFSIRSLWSLVARFVSLATCPTHVVWVRSPGDRRSGLFELSGHGQQPDISRP